MGRSIDFNPDSNWIISCLKDNKLLFGTTTAQTIVYDEISLDTLINILKATSNKDPASILGVDCRIPIFPIAGMMLAYHINELNKPNQIVFAFSRDNAVFEIIESLKAYSINNQPISRYFPIAFINNRLRNMKNILQKRGSITHPRLFFSDTLDEKVINNLLDCGLDPVIFLLDGRTLSPMYFDNLNLLLKKFTNSKFMLLSPSQYLLVPGFNTSNRRLTGWGIPVNPNRGIPLLVNKKIENIDLTPIPISYDLCQCTNSLQDLGKLGDKIPYNFLKMSWSLYRLLLSLPILPNDLNKAWSRITGYLEHPIAGPLARLTQLVGMAYDGKNDAAPYMDNVAHALTSLQERLDKENPKMNTLFKILNDNSNYTIIVNNQTSALALKNILLNHPSDISVKHWYEPPTWAPTDNSVIICCPPPLGREWITTVQISAKVTFLLYPIEAALMKNRYLKIGLNRGKAWKSLEDIINTTPESKEVKMLIELDDPYSIINGLAESSPTDVRLKTITKSENRDEKVEVIPILLEGHGIYWACMNSKIAVIRGGNLYRMEAHNLKINDLVILPRNSPESDIREAIFNAVELKKGNEVIVTEVRKWKSNLIQYRENNNLSNSGLTSILNKNGASVTEHQIRNILGDDDIEEKQIATWNNTTLIKASFKIFGESYNNQQVEKLRFAITRLRGIHQNAGRMLRRLAESSIRFSDEETADIIDTELGLTLEDLRKQVIVCNIEDILERQEILEPIAGTIEIIHEVDQ